LNEENAGLEKTNKKWIDKLEQEIDKNSKQNAGYSQ
jgi:hypothetical protein